MNRIFYAGIGSRRTTPDIIKQMSSLAHRFAEFGFVLRSGAAEGADSAFEAGCRRAKGPFEIFLPFPGFGGRKNEPGIITTCNPKAREFTVHYHPAPSALKGFGLAAMDRNAHQVFGENLVTPATFVVCWTPDGAEHGRETTRDTGGTGQAIRIASDANIPIINLQRPGAFDRAMRIKPPEGYAARYGLPSSEAPPAARY
jgi:hypothetical protein